MSTATPGVAGVASALALLMGSVAALATPPTAPPANPAADENRAALVCTVTSNCVNSLGTSELGPLHFAGTATDAMQALRATLARFAQADIIKADERSIEAVFTTFLGFRDVVDFRIDADSQRIDYRSRSLVGKYDFGKNHARMTAFAAQFAEHAKR